MFKSKKVLIHLLCLTLLLCFFPLLAIHAEDATYVGSDSASTNGVTLTVSWTEPVLGSPTTFHVSATGGSGNYKFNMSAPSYSNPNESYYESVADPSRGEWTNYTDVCESSDFQFTMMASGTYYFNFYVMDMADGGVKYLRTSTFISANDANYPSINSIISDAVTQCNNETDRTEYAKALWLHDWLIDRMDYDNSLKWSSSESALTRGLGTCQSYESAYSKLLTAAGITNAETRDTADGHTWNAVKLDGEWYQVDCTWDDTDADYYNFDARHLYFCLTDELMAIAHKGHANIYTASNYATRSTSLSDNYFVRSGDASNWAESYADRIKQQIESKNSTFTVSADNASYPPSIAGIQNGITAYSLNQMDWSTSSENVTLAVTASATQFECSATYSPKDISFDNYSLGLTGLIEMNFYFNLPDSIVNDEGAYVLFTLPDGRQEQQFVKDVKYVENVGYKFNCGLYAKEMSQPVFAKVVTSDGVESSLYSKSATDYANYILNTDSSSYNKVKPLIKTMLNFGGYAQELFDYKTDELASSKVKEVMQKDMDAVSTTDLEKYKYSVTGTDDNFSLKGISLVIESATSVYAYLDVKDESAVKNTVIKVDGKTSEIKQNKNGYYAEIADIWSNDLGKEHEITINNMSVKCSAYSYVYSVLKNQELMGEKTVNVAKAIYLYGQASKTYFN